MTPNALDRDRQPSSLPLTRREFLPLLGAAAATDNPSFLALDPSLTHLYSTNENGVVNNLPGGRVSAYAIDQGSGTLSFLNTELTNGTFPAHLSVHPSGQFLLASNYGTGNYPIYAIQANG